MIDKGTIRYAFRRGLRSGRFGSLRGGYRRIRAGQGLTDEMGAVVTFFALAVIGTFILGELDDSLDVIPADPANATGAEANYSDAANQTGGGWEDAVGVAVVVPLVVFAGIMLGVIMRFV